VLDPLYKAIGFLLSVAYAIVPAHNLGLAIILMTCVVMLALFPLTAKQARSMISMQKVQPEIKRIQQKYKGDKQKQNEEVLKFYQENKINPLAGCLPLLMQFPIFISLFHVLRSIQSNVPTDGTFNRLFKDICGSAATSAKNCQKPPTGLRFLGMDLSKALWEVRSESVLTLVPYVISILLIIGTGWYQARQTMARQQNNAAASPINSQMQFMTKVFPVVFGLFSLRFASGLVVYWVTSNLWRIGQQHLVLNKIYDTANNAPPFKPAAGDDDDEELPPPKKPSGSGGSNPPAAPKGSGPKGSGGGSAKGGGAAKPVARRPGSPVSPRDPKRGNGAGSGGGAAPAGAGNRRKKRKR
jgi:YidC/Oxa1 family membrane protein insertase